MSEADPPRRRRRVVVVVVALVVVAALGATAAVLVPRLIAPPTAHHRTAALGPTVKVVRQDLTDTTSIDGTLGYGDPTPVKLKASGTVTWLPAVGQGLDRGATIARVDDEPVLVFLGGIPLYRPLDTPGMTGADVSMAAANLAALGLLRVGDPATARVDARFQAAVKTYQKRSGLPEDGVISPAWVLVLPAASRVSAVAAHLGDAAGDAAISVTGTTKSVTSIVDPASIPSVATGTAVTVRLPTGTETAGHVASVGTTITQSTGDGGSDSSRTPQLALVVSLDDASAVASLDAAPVTVLVPTASRTGVLTVPISALLSLREGGFALQTPGGALIGVKAGLFSGDLVEVSGSGLREGMRVVDAR